MLKPDRIIEAQKNFKRYLSEELIRKEPFKKIVFDTYIRNHSDSLIIAGKIYEEKLSNLWTVVTSYYSMFYIANAVLYKMGYKVGSKITHKVTSDALIVLIRNKLTEYLIDAYDSARTEAMALSENLLQNFDYERQKRSEFQYETTEEIARSKAKTSLRRAIEFCAEMEKLII